MECRHRFKSYSAASYHDITLTPLYYYDVETVASQIKGSDVSTARFIAVMLAARYAPET